MVFRKNQKAKFLVKYWLPPLIWALAIFSFSSFPTGTATKIDWTDFVIKKTAHLIEYGVFTLLIYRALKMSGVDKKKSAFISVLVAVIYGLTDEFHQYYVPGRTSKIRDVGFDTIGSIIAIYSIWNILPSLPPRLRSLAKELELI